MSILQKFICLFLPKPPFEVVLPYKKIHELAVEPVYATEGSACFDVYAVETFSVPAYGNVLARTGLVFETPVGYKVALYSRSGHGIKHSVRLANCTGIVDSDYRGEVMFAFHNDSSMPLIVHAGERMGQAEIVPVHRAVFACREELTETDRGAGGFGSTGKL